MPNYRERVLAVLGSTSVGKSALTIMFLNNTFIDYYDPTIEKCYNQRKLINGADYDLTIYDTAGLEEQSQIQTKYINANGFILVYSISDMQSFEIVQNIYNKLCDELNGGIKPVVLIGNKSDLKEQRRVTYENGKKLAESWNAAFLETSAKEGNNVQTVFATLLKEIDPPTNQINQINQQITTNNSSTPSNQGTPINPNAHGNNNSKASRNASDSSKNQQPGQKCIIS